jgi:alkylmercury lyase-like protein
VENSASLDARVRLAVFEEFLREGNPPLVEQLTGRLHLPRDEVESSLARLDVARHLKLVPRTHRILMAFPFSGIATPYRVIVEDQRNYFANCAWDSVAFHPMLNRPIRVESFCHHCGDPIRFRVEDGRGVSEATAVPLVYLAVPAAEWWNDIIATCGNSMVFFGATDHLREWQAGQPLSDGAALTIETVVKLSVPLYSGKMTLGFSRPTRERIVELFRELGLTGKFWEI